MQENEDVLNASESPANDKDVIPVHSELIDFQNQNNMSIEPTSFKISSKQKLFRTGAANILKRIYNSIGLNENVAETVASPVIQVRSNVARRGKPFRSQARRANKYINFKLPNTNPETLNELVSERNFCDSLLKDEGIPSNVRLFIEKRMAYVTLKMYRLI